MAEGNARTILVTGGAGFVGSNLVERLLCRQETQVRVFDNLSRRGAEANLAWLRGIDVAGDLTFVRGDVRDRAALTQAAEGVDEIYHLAAQVAVTTSVVDPRTDFDVNAAGTFNLLEAARQGGRRPLVVFTSTNKVYGSLDGVPVRRQEQRYVAANAAFAGVDEDEPLDFHSPYGCSKGAADQYVRDYARMYDLPTVVLRMSCIAGPRQFGTEDQGWVAHFLYSALEHRRITIYGDGFQVRDVLHVTDLVDAIEAIRLNPARSAGEIFNLGGGPARAVSIIEMLAAIESEIGIAPMIEYADTRPGDQPLYVSNTDKLTERTGWQAHHSSEDILRDIHRFWQHHRELLTGQRGSASAAQQTPLAQEVLA